MVTSIFIDVACCERFMWMLSLKYILIMTSLGKLAPRLWLENTSEKYS